ncbi:hypothetical protein WR25_06454 [Diploscapter pachys]|uniref:Uncharacterized protein n=1 Tax=Diploscapter pachys TaxID=2018661 RepID=A0A2A2K979_9BILA|nr:hypothetical protein WR25_06454 [Diploscapter pachys]
MIVIIGLAFDELTWFINIWHQNGDISTEWKKALLMALDEARQYLHTDYKIHVKMDSPVADHCVRFALSDPSNVNYRSKCDSADSPYPHTHNAVCDRCQAVKKVLGDVKDTAEQLKLEVENELKKNANNQNLKDKVRADTIDGLKEGDAMLTFDYAMKQEKERHRETQAQWYGKSGNGWHIVHVVANISKVLVEHNFVHILTGDLQDSATVVAIMRHILPELNKMGILRVTIRSDNAGAYKSIATISSVPDIQSESGVKIIQYQFSETQAGKSSADRVAAIVKKKLGSYIAAGGDATTPKSFFDAITVGQLIRATSIYLVSVEGEIPNVKSKLIGMSTLFDFTFTDNGFVCRRYHNFGNGYTHDARNLIKLPSKLNILESGGILTNINHIIDERKALEKGMSGLYWRALRCPANDQACIAEEIEAELHQEDLELEKADKKKEPLYPFSCPVEGQKGASGSRSKRNSEDHTTFIEELVNEFNENQGDVELIGIKDEEAESLESLIWEVIEDNAEELFDLSQPCRLPDDMKEDILGKQAIMQ